MDDAPPLPALAPCPICRKPATRVHRPFCSVRCRDIDLGRWLRDVYRVETEEGPQENREENG
jgi:endogenous inhibitor of DNA gyrase (YacG/DUF329 family)